LVFGLICHCDTQVTFQLQQKCIQVMRSNKIVRRIPTESNSTPAMDLGHMNVVRVMYLYVGGRFGNKNGFCIITPVAGPIFANFA